MDVGGVEKEASYAGKRTAFFAAPGISSQQPPGAADRCRGGLCPGQPKILEYLLEHDGCIARDICSGCVLDKSTMTSLLARMEKQGLVRKEESGDDRRAVHIYMTEKGRTLAERIKLGCLRLDETALQGISQEELGTDHSRLLKQMIENLEGGGA